MTNASGTTPNLLAIETATEACSLALQVGQSILARHVVAGREQTQVLLPLVHELLAEAGIGFKQLDGLVCSVGPGSFAGVRVGVGYAKGLAFARELPIVPVTSLATLAQGALRRTRSTRALACIDARMGEIYAGEFECDASGLMQPRGALCVCHPDELRIALQPPWVASGTGWGTYGTLLRARAAAAPCLEEPQALPEAHDALALAAPLWAQRKFVDAAALEPLYLRDRVAATLEEQARIRAQNKQPA